MNATQLAGLITLFLFVARPPMFGQPDPSGRRFDVVSIKPYIESSGEKTGTKIVGDRVDMIGVSMVSLFPQAFETSGSFFIGVPNEPLWTIHALMPAGSTEDQLREMMRTMLEERFHLSIHRETREVNGYALVVAAGGPTLMPARSLDRSLCTNWIQADDYETCVQVGSGKRITMSTAGGGIVNRVVEGIDQREWMSTTMPRLATFLTGELTMDNMRRRGGFHAVGAPQLADYSPVSDNTGLNGQWNVTIRFDLGTGPDPHFSTVSDYA